MFQVKLSEKEKFEEERRRLEVNEAFNEDVSHRGHEYDESMKLPVKNHLAKLEVNK